MMLAVSSLSKLSNLWDTVARQAGLLSLKERWVWSWFKMQVPQVSIAMVPISIGGVSHSRSSVIGTDGTTCMLPLHWWWLDQARVFATKVTVATSDPSRQAKQTLVLMSLPPFQALGGLVDQTTQFGGCRGDWTTRSEVHILMLFSLLLLIGIHEYVRPRYRLFPQPINVPAPSQRAAQ
jgi:hypothetical protein